MRTDRTYDIIFGDASTTSRFRITSHAEFIEMQNASPEAERRHCDEHHRQCSTRDFYRPISRRLARFRRCRHRRGESGVLRRGLTVDSGWSSHGARGFQPQGVELWCAPPIHQSRL